MMSGSILRGLKWGIWLSFGTLFLTETDPIHYLCIQFSSKFGIKMMLQLFISPKELSWCRVSTHRLGTSLGLINPAFLWSVGKGKGAGRSSSSTLSERTRSLESARRIWKMQRGDLWSLDNSVFNLWYWSFIWSVCHCFDVSHSTSIVVYSFWSLKSAIPTSGFCASTFMSEERMV